nr:retrovirus-related Pol polyprotein from transposon TNT 1-94 [Tanacetum cinerariifolium]
MGNVLFSPCFAQLLVAAVGGILYCMICKREDHKTSDHEMYTASLKRSENYKAQSYQMVENQNDVKVKQIITDNGTEFRTHKLESFCDEKGISQNFSSLYTPEQNCVAERKNRTLIEIHDKTPYEIFRETIPDISYFDVFGCPVFIHNHKDHLGKFDAKADDGYFLGYSFVSKSFRVFNTRRKQVEETYHVTFDESMEAIRYTNTLLDEIGIDDSSRYPPDEFLQEDDLSRQYQVDSDVSYYIMPHGRSLTELSQDNQVSEVIAPNEHDIPHTEDTKDPPDLTNTKGTHEQIVHNDQMITQPTNIPPGNNTKVSGSLTEPLVPDVTQSHISNQSSTSFHPDPQDRWSSDQHIKLVNIIGDPGEGVLTRSMAAKLTAASANECLFADFLSEIEPKKILVQSKGITSNSYEKNPQVLGRKSTLGACQILGGKLVCWSAKNQQSVAMSLVEVEYVATAKCCANILWMKSQLSDYDIHYKMVPIFCDNTNAIAISNNHKAKEMEISDCDSAKPKKWKSQTVTPTLPKSQGPEVPGALSKKKKKA